MGRRLMKNSKTKLFQYSILKSLDQCFFHRWFPVFAIELFSQREPLQLWLSLKQLGKAELGPLLVWSKQKLHAWGNPYLQMFAVFFTCFTSECAFSVALAYECHFQLPLQFLWWRFTVLLWWNIHPFCWQFSLFLLFWRKGRENSWKWIVIQSMSNFSWSDNKIGWFKVVTSDNAIFVWYPVFFF